MVFVVPIRFLLAFLLFVVDIIAGGVWRMRFSFECDHETFFTNNSLLHVAIAIAGMNTHVGMNEYTGNFSLHLTSTAHTPIGTRVVDSAGVIQM